MKELAGSQIFVLESIDVMNDLMLLNVKGGLGGCTCDNASKYDTCKCDHGSHYETCECYGGKTLVDTGEHEPDEVSFC